MIKNRHYFVPSGFRNFSATNPLSVSEEGDSVAVIEPSPAIFANWRIDYDHQAPCPACGCNRVDELFVNKDKAKGVQPECTACGAIGGINIC